MVSMNRPAVLMAAVASAAKRRGGGADSIVSPRLELVGGAEEGHKIAAYARLVSCQPGKLAAHTAMRFCHLAGVLEYVSLGGMEHSDVCFTRGDVRERQSRNLGRIGKGGARFAEIVGGFGLHRSNPSLRSSCMKPVRSRYAPAGNGVAEMTAPVSNRISVLTFAKCALSSEKLPGSLIKTAMS